MPARIKAEATRKPTAIPAQPLGLEASKTLAARLRASELRYHRALIDATEYHEATRPKGNK